MPRRIKNKDHKVVADSFLLRDLSKISLSIWSQLLVVAVELVTSEQSAEKNFAESILISSSNMTKFGDIYSNKKHTCCDS